MSQYKFARDRDDNSVYASGMIFRTGFGRPGFPIRLASEIMETCFELRRKYFGPLSVPATVYDPFCGTAFLLSILGVRFWGQIGSVIGSDIDQAALLGGQHNLELLTSDRLITRIEQLNSEHQSVGSKLHSPANGQSINATLRKVEALPFSVQHKLFVADAADADTLLELLRDHVIDFVVTDLPYERISSWKGRMDTPSDSRASLVLGSLARIVNESTIVAIVSRKGELISHPNFDKFKTFKIGKRKITFLRLASPHLAPLPSSLR